MKTYFITGISGGLGHELAVQALKAGNIVIGTTRSQKSAADFMALDSRNAHAFVLDITNEQAIADCVAKAEAISGKIDVVINNAGYGLTGAIEELESKQVRDLFDVNIFAPLAVIRAVLPKMRANKSGHIINIGSVSGLAAWMGTGIYGASKFAIECISRTLAQEVKPLGINVTSVAPGGLRTNFAGTSLHDAKTPIADYDTTAHEAFRILTGHKGHEPNDTSLAAKAILSVAGSEDAPLLLLLGEDALKYTEYEIANIQGEIAKWKDLTLSTTAKD